jgi:CheY-like chemotaxis protein
MIIMSQRPTVLVVDDVPLNRMMIGLALRQMGCEVVEACDGVEALAALEIASFVLIVMDCQMPVMDGLAAARSIRAAELQVPIVAYTTEDNREECLAAGMDDYLAKPAPLGVLKAKLSSWIEQAAA